VLTHLVLYLSRRLLFEELRYPHVRFAVLWLGLVDPKRALTSVLPNNLVQIGAPTLTLCSRKPIVKSILPRFCTLIADSVRHICLGPLNPLTSFVLTRLYPQVPKAPLTI
jgi:hypothetical protein